ncbi:TPA: OmpA family protein [Photobacterium damselae]
MSKYKSLSLAVAISLGVTSCASNNFGGISTPTLIGCASGVIIGGLAGKAIGDDQGALIGAGVGALIGCSAGYYWTIREENLAKLAEKEKIDVAFERVGSKTDQNNDFVVVQAKEIIKAQEQGKTDSIDKVVGGADIVGLSATVKGNIFAGGQTRITSQKHKRFFQQYAETAKDSGSAILVIGHTDSSGSAQTNAKVSYQRAKSVAQELIKNGIDKKDIYIYGAGESQPIASNLSASGRAENRRIEIVSLNNKPEYVTDFVRYKESEPAFATLRSRDNLAKHSKKVSRILLANNTDQTKTQQVVKQVVNQQNKRSETNKAFVNFSGELYQGTDENLFVYIGDRNENTFSIIGQAVASSIDVASCVYDEPQITTQIRRLSDEVSNTQDYLPGMNRTAWWGKVANHGVAVSPVAVSRKSYSITEAPVIMVYEDYFKGSQHKPMKTHKLVDVNIYNGSKGVIYRAFIKDKNYPIKCIDLALDKKSHNGSFKAFDGKIYYQGPNGLMIADYKPGKA